MRIKDFLSNISKSHIFIFILYLIFSLLLFSYPLINKMIILNGDTPYYYYPLLKYYSDFAHKGFSLWMPYEFLGLPFLGTLQTGLFYPLNLIYFIIPAEYAFNISTVLHYALAGFFMYLFLSTFVKSRHASFLSGLIFAFSGFMAAKIVYTSMLNAAVWLPLLLYFYEKIRQTSRMKYSIWASIVTAVQILAGHFQITVYTFLLLGFFVIFFVWEMEKNIRIKFLLLSALPVIIGSILALPQLVSTLELSKLAWRAEQDYSFLSFCSFNPLMTILFFFPFIFGKGYGNPLFYTDYNISMLWDEWQIYEYLPFIGVFTLVFALVFFLKQYKRDKNIIFWGITSVFSFLLALGKYASFHRVMCFLPVYNLFRIPSRHLLVFDVAVLVIFALGMEYLINCKEKSKKFFYYLFSFLALIPCSSIILSYFFRYITQFEPKNHNYEFSMMKVIGRTLNFDNIVFLIPTAFIIGYLVLLFSYYKLGISKKIFINLISILIIIEIISFFILYMSGCKPIAELQQEISSDELNFLASDQGFNRNAVIKEKIFPIVNIPRNISLLNGFDPLSLSSYYYVTGMLMVNYCDWHTLLKNNLLLSALNVKYISFNNAVYQRYKSILSASAVKDNNSSLSKIPVKLIEKSNLNVTCSKNEKIMRAPDNEKSSTLWYNVKLKPDTTYVLSADIKSEKPTATVYFYVYNNEYNDGINIPLNFSIHAKDIGSTYKNFFYMFSIAKNAFNTDIFLYTYSRNPVCIKNIQLWEAPNYLPPIKNSSITDAKLYKEVFNKDGTKIFENLNCLPKAYSVENLKFVDSIQAVRRAFYFFEFNPADTALIYNNDLHKIGNKKFAKGNVKIISYEADKVSIKADFKGTGFLVLAEQYYPGWKAFIDGKETRIYPANGICRGIVVPAGSHSIEFRYVPVNVYIAAVISIIMLAFCIILLILLNKKQKHSDNPSNAED